jgi:cob(I)alamin adenosyltransferase
MRQEQVDHAVIIYLNRLSDALFVLARWTAHRLGESELLWERTKPT